MSAVGALRIMLADRFSRLYDNSTVPYTFGYHRELLKKALLATFASHKSSLPTSLGH